MRLKFFYLVFLLFISETIQVLAGNHPEANFGIYGIQHQITIGGYQQYVGQTVKYLPASLSSLGNYDDQEQFLKYGGSYDKEYIIVKISGNDKQMVFHLREKDGKKKIKMFVNNQEESMSYGKYTYCITDKYSIPLLLIDKYRENKANYVGKIFPKEENSSIKMEVVDLSIIPSKKTDYDHHKGYPSIVMTIKDLATGKIYNPSINADLSIIGTEFTNSKFKCKYNVISIFEKKSERYPFDMITYYVVKNSINGITKEVRESRASEFAFSLDDSGFFIASLTKVEKPLNSEIRYGETKTIVEQDLTKYSYVDNIIGILIYADEERFNFILKNNSNHSIKIIWDEAVFVDIDGHTSKVMHSGIKYSQKETEQSATTIIKGAKLEDVAVPINNVYYSDYFKDWRIKSLYGTTDKTKQGQIIRLMLPIQVKDIINEYIFEFELKYVYKCPECLIDL